MNAEIVSLSKARKAQKKTRREKSSALNRLKFGRTNSQQAAEKHETDTNVRMLDFARRTAPAEREPNP